MMLKLLYEYTLCLLPLPACVGGLKGALLFVRQSRERGKETRKNKNK